MVGDPARLRQVLVIALTNVMSHAPGSGVLRIEVEARPGEVVLHVLDRGPGLTAEAEARAFERFWRAEPDRKRGPRGSGSGLGLPVARAITEAHGGTVRLVARTGGGAHFEMILPRTAPDQT
jgi:signal transduction histidine kinase